MKTAFQGKVNIRLGKTGILEGVSVTSVCLTVNGLFTSETKNLYTRGNASYLTLPIAMLLSLLLFLLMLSVMDRVGAGNLGELLTLGFGKRLSVPSSFLLYALLLFAAYLPLSQFIRAMHGLFFEGASYTKLVLYVLPAMLFIAWLGLETISRTAKIYSSLLIAFFVLAVLSSATEFETYRLYPLFGNGLKNIVVQIFEEIGTFLPAFLSLLAVSDGFNGLESTKKIGIISGFTAMVICAIGQLTIGLVYTYKELSGVFIPLFRVSYLNLFEAHLMRMDKLAHMAWLNGSILAGSFYIYAGARQLVQSLNIRDVRPALTASSILTALMILFETEMLDNSFFVMIKGVMFNYGFLLASLPVLACAGLSMVRSKRRNS